MDTQVADPLLGSLVDGRYRIRARVARGGAATVYTATDERLDRMVAVKISHQASWRTGPGGDEAKTIARLTHPNIVAVYDQGVHRGLPYLVMEYVRGRTLRDVLAERRQLQPVEALAIMEQMLAAIAAAHRAGLVHRDVKPENVLVAEAPSGGSANLVDSVVKVADFGLARAVAAGAEDPTSGQLMATVAYVAPELVTAGHADPRTDVYAAGIVLFEMLTGRVPFDGDRPVEVAWQHVDHDVPAPSRFVPVLSPVLDELVRRATRRDPGARPTDAGAMLAEVQQARDDLGTSAATTTRLRPVAEPTVVVSQVPAWGPPPDTATRHRRPPRAPGWSGRLLLVWRGLTGRTAGRIGLTAAVVAASLVVLVGGWYVAFGRYTEAPLLVNLSRTQAQAQASGAGFRVVYGQPRYNESVDADVVLSQQPSPGDRVVKGGAITLVLSLGPERVQVPDVVGQAFAVASAEVQANHLKPKRGADQFDGTVPAGNVLSVNPAVGADLKPGAEVTLTVSKGKPPVSVPNLVGLTVGEAQGKLQQQELVADVEQVDSPDKPAGEVLDQDPKAGTGVEKNSRVTLKVSKGPPLVVVPGVVGQNCQQARQQLEASGFKVNIQGVGQTVQFQNPGQNSQVPSGTEVTIRCFF